ncbi:MAG: primase C-terminal domain-containing protein [Peptostreptococcaceae bacterium]
MTEQQKKQLLEYLKFVLPTIENNDNEQGYLWINNPKNNFNMQRYFNTYAEGVALIEKYRHNQCYIGLATTDGAGYKLENLINRSTILIDIDEEELEINQIYDLCKKNQIFAHMVVNSGRGWHIYLKLDNSYPIEEVTRVNKRLVQMFNADENACTSTQIIRVPFTKNFKVDEYASIVNANNQVKSYTLKKLDGHKPIEFKNNNTELEFDNINDLYCFNQLVKNGSSKGFRNKALIFISSTCKYADINESRAVQYAYEFNSNCKEPQTKSEVIKVIRSIYSNTSKVKPCTTALGQKLCSTQCRSNIITVDDVLSVSNVNIDNRVVGLTKGHIIAKAKDKKGVKKHMLEVLNGTELTIIAMLKVCNDRLFTKEDIVNFIEVSEPTVRKALKSLEDKNIILSTKQNINKASKPTMMYSYNFEFEKYNKEIVHLNTNLFTARLQKLIKDNDLKVAIALRYLMASRQDVTLENVAYVSGVDVSNINKSINSLKKSKLVIVDKIKTSKGKCNSYQLFY